MTVYGYVKTVDTDGRCGGGFVYDRIQVCQKSRQMAAVEVDLYMTVYRYVKKVNRWPLWRRNYI